MIKDTIRIANDFDSEQFVLFLVYATVASVLPTLAVLASLYVGGFDLSKITIRHTILSWPYLVVEVLVALSFLFRHQYKSWVTCKRALRFYTVPAVLSALALVVAAFRFVTADLDPLPVSVWIYFVFVFFIAGCMILFEK